MENLIQQLKDNEKPFGLMSEEMQEKAKEMPWKHFQVWGYVGSEDKWIMPGSDTFRSHFTYRLRPDYEDEPPAEVTISRVTLEAIIEIAQKALDK